jgi:IS1 family transposase
LNPNDSNPLVSINDVIFQTHTLAELPTRASASDITCIVQDGFCTYRRYYQEEDAGTGKESRLSRFLDHTSTRVHDSTLNYFLWGWCVRAQ